MAKTDLEQLVVGLSADIKQYEKALAKAHGQTQTAMRKIAKEAEVGIGKFEKIIGGANSALSSFGKGLVIGGITAAVAGLEAIVRSSVETAAAIGDLSEKLGITSTQLQELQFGAVQANLGFDDLESGLLKFNKALGEARNGQGDLLKLFEANGIDKAKVRTLDYAEALNTVADFIKNAANEQDAFLINTQAFGKGNDGFVEFLRNGSSGLQQFATDAKNAGAIISEDLVKSAQAFDDAWAAALLSVKSKIGDLVLSAIPMIQKFDKMVSDAADNLGLALGTLTPESIAARNPAAAVPTQTVNQAGKGDLRPTTTKIFDPEIAAAKTKSSNEAAAAAKRHAAEIQRVVDALNLEAATIGKSNLQQEIATALARADVDAKTQQGKAISDLVTRNELLKAVYETSQFAAEQAAQKQEDYISSLNYLAESGISSLEGWISGTERLSDVVGDLSKELLKAAVQASLLGQGPLGGLFGTSGAGGGLFSKLLGGLPSFSGLYASGGKIPAGSYGIAGERGPELISGPSNVIPMSKVGGRSGVNVTVINNAGVEVRTSQDSRGNPIIELRKAVADVIGGGHADGAFANRYGAAPKKQRRF